MEKVIHMSSPQFAAEFEVSHSRTHDSCYWAESIFIFNLSASMFPSFQLNQKNYQKNPILTKVNIFIRAQAYGLVS